MKLIKEYKEFIKKYGNINCPNLDLPDEIIKYVSKYDSPETLLMNGGIPIEYLERLAFGFSENDITELHPSQLKIRWRNDLENVKYEIKQSGLSDIEWSKQVNLTEPIDVDYWEDHDLGYKKGFYVQDGHHRYYAAKTLNKKLNVNLEIKLNPIVELSDVGYDELHICIFKQVKG
jgi:hypothetical protein